MQIILTPTFECVNFDYSQLQYIDRQMDLCTQIYTHTDVHEHIYIFNHICAFIIHLRNNLERTKRVQAENLKDILSDF